MSLSDPSRHAASIMNPIEGRLGYKFRNGLLLAEAMTHPSISLERKNYPFDNQRLQPGLGKNADAASDRPGP